MANTKFRIEDMRNLEIMTKNMIRTFKVGLWGFLICLLLMVLGVFWIITQNQDRVYLVDGSFGTKRISTYQEKLYYFSASYSKLLFEGTKYTFDTSLNVAFHLSVRKSQAQDYIKGLVNSDFYETAKTENAELLCNVDSVKIVGSNPSVVQVYLLNSRVNANGRLNKKTVFNYLISNADFSNSNPFGLKVQKIELVSDEIIIDKK